MDKDYWVFMAFTSITEYKECKPFCTKVFFDHTELKAFSANHSSVHIEEYPYYVSEYDKVEVKISHEEWYVDY